MRRLIDSGHLKKVLIVHPEGNSLANPSLKALIDLLLDNGIEVTVRWRGQGLADYKYKNLRSRRWNSLWYKLIEVGIDRICSVRIARLIAFIEYLILPKGYDLIIAVDRLALIECCWLSKLLDKPLIFISFEILFSEETGKRFKKLERIASQRVSYWIAQDENRAGALVTENQLDIKHAFTLPLASSGLPAAATFRLRDKLGIPPNQRVAMIIGSLSEWTMTERIVKNLARWPDNWSLIIHERYGRTISFLNKMNLNQDDLAKLRLVLSTDAPQLVDQMQNVLAGVDLGLAFYKPTYRDQLVGKNLELIGLSSGKISTFLRHGVPILCNRIGLYSEYAEQHGFGCVVGSPECIHKQLNQLDCLKMSTRAQSFFSASLDFDLYKEEIQEMLWKCSANLPSPHASPISWLPRRQQRFSVK